MSSWESWGDGDLGGMGSRMLDRGICFQPKQKAKVFKGVVHAHACTQKPERIVGHLVIAQFTLTNSESDIFLKRPNGCSCLCPLTLPVPGAYRHVSLAMYMGSTDLKSVPLFLQIFYFIFIYKYMRVGDMHRCEYRCPQSPKEAMGPVVLELHCEPT